MAQSGVHVGQRLGNIGILYWISFNALKVSASHRSSIDYVELCLSFRHTEL